MDSKSSAQIVSRGQVQEFKPTHPLENDIIATVSVGVRAPSGYGAQRVIMLANIHVNDMATTPYHHSALGSKLPISFSPSSLRRTLVFSFSRSLSSKIWFVHQETMMMHVANH